MMKVEIGDLVGIFDGSSPGPAIHTVGLVTAIVGYKTAVLVDGVLESWDISDLKTMKLRKEEHEAR